MLSLSIPEKERFAQAMNGRFLCFAPISYVSPENRSKFGPIYQSLTGTGSIQGYPVKCISVEWMVKFHSGYELDENDYRDVSALCERFGIALPTEYERFTREGAE